MDFKAESLDVELFLSEWIASQDFNAMMVIISDNFYNEIAKIVQNGVESGMTRAEIAKSLQSMQDINKRRSMVIARTETHKAAMYASERQAKAISNELNIAMRKTMDTSR